MVSEKIPPYKAKREEVSKILSPKNKVATQSSLEKFWEVGNMGDQAVSLSSPPLAQGLIMSIFCSSIKL
jgi:hypothetical protein